MGISLTFRRLLLLFGGWFLFANEVDVEAKVKVYYVKPSHTDTPNYHCPGKPCHTLDYYEEHKTWNKNKTTDSITLMFLGGNYNIKTDHETNNLPASVTPRLKLIGVKPAHDVILHLHNASSLSFSETAEIHFENLTFLYPNSSKFATQIQLTARRISLVRVAFIGVHLSLTHHYFNNSGILMTNSNLTGLM